MKHYKVSYLIGSLARESINRKLAGALIRLAPENLTFTEISFRDLPLDSYDYDADYPVEARAFKDAIKAGDALLFVTPEYNRSIPGGLKKASTGLAGLMAPTASPTNRPPLLALRPARSAPPSRSRAFAACLVFAPHLR